MTDTTASTETPSPESAAAPVELTEAGHHPLEKIAPKVASAPPPTLIERLVDNSGRHETKAEYVEAVEQLLLREDGKAVLARLLSGNNAGEAREPRRDRERGGRDGGRGERDRPAGGRDARGPSGGRDGGRRDERSAGGPSGGRGERDRGRGDRPSGGRDGGRRDERPARPAQAAGDRPEIGGTIENTQGKEFWEAWVDNQNPDAPRPPEGLRADGDRGDRPAREPRPPREPREPREPRAPLPELPAGQVRLYLNLGQRTRSSEEEIRGLLTSHSITPIALDMRPHHTFVIVEEAQSQLAQTALAGQSWQGRALRCEVAKA